MLIYPKIAHEVLLIRAIFLLGCGCDVKNPVQPCWFIGKVPLGAFFYVVVPPKVGALGQQDVGVHGNVGGHSMTAGQALCSSWKWLLDKT